MPQVAILFGGNDHMFEFNEIRNVATIGYDTGAIYGGRDLSSRVSVSCQCPSYNKLAGISLVAEIHPFCPVQLHSGDDHSLQFVPPP